jgi:hypothetical protein
VLRYRVGAKTTRDLEVVEAELRRLLEAMSDRPLRLDPRSGTANGDVAPVLDLAIDAGYRDVRFMAAPRN